MKKLLKTGCDCRQTKEYIRIIFFVSALFSLRMWVRMEFRRNNQLNVCISCYWMNCGRNPGPWTGYKSTTNIVNLKCKMLREKASKRYSYINIYKPKRKMKMKFEHTDLNKHCGFTSYRSMMSSFKRNLHSQKMGKEKDF